MTSRRIISSEKTYLEKDDSIAATPSASEKSNTSPAVPASVIVKLLGFTIAMFVGPISVYFLTVNTIYKGNSTWAGATAAIAANVVLIAYVIVAMREDQGEDPSARERARKAQ